MVFHCFEIYVKFPFDRVIKNDNQCMIDCSERRGVKIRVISRICCNIVFFLLKHEIIFTAL